MDDIVSVLEKIRDNIEELKEASKKLNMINKFHFNTI